MSCAPDFGNVLWFVGMTGLSAGILYGTCLLDQDYKGCDKARLWKNWLIGCSVIGGGLWRLVTEAGPVIKIGFLLLALYLVVCSVLDSMFCMVNDFLHYVGLAGGILLVFHTKQDGQIGVSLVLFALIQAFWFRKMYGGADVMAFVVCAVYFAAMNRDMERYLYHMIGCYLVLAMVQGLKGNINKKGNLKKPVPMIPYISVSFLLNIY